MGAPEENHQPAVFKNHFQNSSSVTNEHKAEIRVKLSMIPTNADLLNYSTYLLCGSP